MISYLTSDRTRGYPHPLIEKLPSRLNLLNGSRLYYKTIRCEKKFCLLLSYKVIPPTTTSMLGTKSDAVSVRAVASHQCWSEFQSHLPHSANNQKQSKF